MSEADADRPPRLRIELPAARAPAYDVVLEPAALQHLPALLRDVAPAHRYALIADQNVASLHGERIAEALRAAGLRADLFRFPAGEANKTRDTWAALSDALLADGFGRDGCIVALGGGVTCDLAGFVAATLLRGVPCVQLPSSLLAMIDAAVGGKTGVDVPAGKNLVGAFAQPRLVVIDPHLLRTLPRTELRSGLAEAVKHAAIRDEAHLRWIRAHGGALLDGDAMLLAALVERSVRIKAEFVASDPLEHGPRAALNFGHTIAHALERASGYAIGHGAAVAIGMTVEAMLGESLGITEHGAAGELREVLHALELPVELPDGTDAEAVLAAASFDKKVRRDTLRFSLIERIGRIARAPTGEWTHPVRAGDAHAALLRALPGRESVGNRAPGNL